MGLTAKIENSFGKSIFKDCWQIETSCTRKVIYSIYKRILDVLGWEYELARFCNVGEIYLLGSSVLTMDKPSQAALFIYVYSQIYVLTKCDPSIEEMFHKERIEDIFVQFKMSSVKSKEFLMHVWGIVNEFEDSFIVAKSMSMESFDSSLESNEAMLMRLWKNLQPDTPLQKRKSSEWKSIGFQGTDPATDFRGMGILGLQQLVDFSGTCEGKSVFCALTSGKDEYFPFAIAGINITNAIMNLPKKRLFVLFLRDWIQFKKSSNIVVNSRLAFFTRLYEQIFINLLAVWNSSDRNISNFNSYLQCAIKEL